MTTLPRSLRGRLTLVFAAVAAVLVGAFAWLLVALVQHAVWDPLDVGLGEEAATLGTLTDLPPPRLENAVRSLGEEGDLGPGKFVRVVAADRRVLARFRGVPAAVAARRPATIDQLQLATVGEGRVVHRVAWAPAHSGGWVVVGVRAANQAMLVRRATAVIAATATALVVLLSALAWAITSRATADLTRLAAELETVEAGSLGRRLATRSTTEVDRVVHVLNWMLERLESAVTHLQRFTADAAHELRTPLAALRAHLEGSIARATTEEDRRIGLVDALEQAERLQRLSEDLLTLSAVESDAANRPHADQPVRLDVLVQEIADSLRPIAEEQGRPFASDASAPVTVYGVAPLLKRVVVNLIDNAFRHTPDGTPIRVTLQSRVADAVAVLAVTDHGPGMAAAELGTVFERFRKGRASRGAGLGLALAREIAHRHGGSVTLVSSPEGGTIATLLVPLATPPASV